MSRRNRKPPPAAPVRATIESLAHDGRGVAHVNGKANFIDGLLPAGPDSVRPLWPEDARLSYRLAEFDVELEFLPTDFTQVNGAINGAMVQRALDLLDIHPDERVLDLFCGIGNFT